MSKHKSTTFFPISDWAAGSQKGRGKGSDKKQRYGIALSDKRNWALALEREGYPPLGQAFGGRLKNVLVNSYANTGQKLDVTLAALIPQLTEWLNVPYNADGKTPVEIVMEIDAIFNTDLSSDTLNRVIAEALGAKVEDEEVVEVEE